MFWRRSTRTVLLSRCKLRMLRRASSLVTQRRAHGVIVAVASANYTNSRSKRRCQGKLLRADPAASVGDNSMWQTAAGIASAQEVLLRARTGRHLTAGSHAALAWPARRAILCPPPTLSSCVEARCHPTILRGGPAVDQSSYARLPCMLCHYSQGSVQ